MVDLNPVQFEPFWGNTRKVGDEVQHFAGWHVSGKPLKFSPKHRHDENFGDAERGDLYTSFDPKFWGDRGDRATEVWSPHVDSGFDVVDLSNHNENIVPKDEVRLGKTMPFEEAENAAKPYAEYEKSWESSGGLGQRPAGRKGFSIGTDVTEKHLGFLKDRGLISDEDSKSMTDYINGRRRLEPKLRG